jgi:integrase
LGRIALSKKLWSIPPERFKSNATHLVPLTDEAIAILKALPEFGRGEYLFSTSSGQSSVAGFAKAKQRLDRLMVEELGSAPPPFVLHDLRRTVRTRLASLRVSDLVAEMIIGHGRRGLQRVYDQHSYEPEMREALQLWAAHLRDIVERPPENVVKLKQKKKA